MQFLQTFHLAAFADTAVSYFAAFLFGTLIGAERQYRQRTAGLRTNALVALGAAAFVDLAHRLGGGVEAVRVISYVVSGVGFLGAGVIMKEGLNVRGLNTAATLWCSAATGACAGVDMLAEGALLTGFILAGNTLLRPLVNAINRIPIGGAEMEATYTVNVLTDGERTGELRDLLVERLEAAQYPVADVELHDRGGEGTEIIATLTSSAVDTAVLDALTTRLDSEPDVDHATWLAKPQS